MSEINRTEQEPEGEQAVKKGVKKYSFQHNSKYYSICVYTVVTVAVCAVIIRSVFMMEATLGMIKGMIRWLMPYLLGLFLVGLLYPMVRYFEKRRRQSQKKFVSSHSRGFAILETYLIFIGMIVFLFAVIIPQMTKSIQDMVTAAPGWYKEVLQWLEALDKRSPDFDMDFIINALSNFGNSMFTAETIQNRLGEISEIAKTVLSTSYSVVQVLGELLIALIMSAYILIDLNRIGRCSERIFNSFLNKKDTERIFRVMDECYEIFASFVSGKMVDSLIIGILCCLLMTILRLPYALVISVVVGITNMIPYFGPFIGMIPGLFIMIMESPIKAVIFLIMIFALQQFDGWYLGPRILGNSTGLRPAWIIFSVAAGGAIAGVIGMFLGVPVAAVIGHLFNLWIEYHRRKHGRD